MHAFYITTTVNILYYPHMLIGKVLIYRLMFVCLCFLFVRLRISLLRIKLMASYFVRRFIGVQGRESVLTYVRKLRT